MDGDAALRVFRVSVDVRSFKAGVKLPMRAANVFVKVILPSQIVKLALETPHPGNAAKLTAPLRSHPPILVERCTEVAIPNGYVALELPVSVLDLAATLAQDPQLTAEVYHRDKYAADSLLGTAHIPMTPLMHEPRLDGYAPVKGDRRSDQVTIGSLRIVLAAEELGPVSGHQKRTENGGGGAQPPSFQTAGLEESFLILKNNITQFLGAKGVSVQTEQQTTDRTLKEAAAKIQPPMKESPPTPAVAAVQPADASAPPPARLNGTVRDNNAARTAGKGDDVREQAEYEMAWEFEMWRRTEEARWRADLKDKEAAMLRALEEDARRREAERTTAVDRVRTDLANLEAKLRTKLLAVEKRERTLMLAEEEAFLKGEALERECTQRVADAESAAKRTLADCNHRLELEHARQAMLQEQCAALEQRLANANAAFASIENEFAAFKAMQRSSSEAELSAQVLLLKHRCIELEKKLETTMRARNDFKSQVLRLAKELAGMRQKTTRSMDERGNAALASLIEVHAQKANEERLELKHLKEQVERLQLQEQQAGKEARRESKTAAAEKSGGFSPENANHGFHDVPQAHHNVAQAEISRYHNVPKPETSRYNDVAQPETSRYNNISQPETSRYDVPQPDVTLPDEPLPPFKEEASSHGKDEQGMEAAAAAAPFSFEDGEPFVSQITAFQRAEIARLNKQKADLLQTGVYTPNDRIIKGLDQEIKRLQSVDTRQFNF